MNFDYLSLPTRWVFLTVVAALAAASLATIWLQRRSPERDFRELRARVRTWWIIVALFGLAMLLSRGGAIAFFALVSGLALREYLSLVPPRVTDWRVIIWAYLCIPLQYLWIYMEWYGVFIIFIPVYAFLFFPARLVLLGQTEGFIQSTSAIHWGLMTTVFCLSHAAYLFVMEPGVAPRWPMSSDGLSPSTVGPALLLFLILLTELNDIFQYLWGKSFGKAKLTPKVSPGKTVAGFVGGVATTTLLAAVIGPWLTILDRTHALGAGLLIGLAGVAGDLSISAIKRDLGVKDSGHTLPGHGGILDRVDSLTYTAPLFFHYVWFGYG
ncbi:MAG: phosphatidate cytidylyltransferase [Pirellulales bacterium]